MSTRAAGVRRATRLAPEVVQTSAMDCGPASLKCILDGHSMPVSYARLRDACQTDVDGTSIDTMESVANQLGLTAEQIVIPADHVLLPAAAALPAIVVVRLSDRLTHFVVAWRRHGPWVQVMDPASGRRWVRCDDFQRELYIHRMTAPASDWREWAGSGEFTVALQARLLELGLRKDDAASAVARAATDESWLSLASLDAVTRMTQSLVNAGGVRRGREASALVHRLVDDVRAQPDRLRIVPARFWSALPDETSQADDVEQLSISGAVLVRFPVPTPSDSSATDPRGNVPSRVEREEGRDDAPSDEPDAGTAASAHYVLGEQTLAGLPQAAARPFREMFALVREDRSLSLPAVTLATFVSALGVVIEALLFNSLLAVGRDLGVREQRIAALALVIGFTLLVTAADLLLTSWLLDAGRRLDVRLRLRFFSRVPRLGDRYFHSRLTSDIAERVHSLHQMRALPSLAGRLVRVLLQLLATALGIVWFDRASALPVLMLAAAVMTIPLLAQPVLAELELRMRTHAGALSRYYLDALMGLIAVRAHGAERPLRREHGRVLAEWMSSGMQWLRASVAVDAAQTVFGCGFAAWLLWSHLARGGDATSLLILYWTLSIPVLGDELAALVRQYTPMRNVLLRLLEPLQSPVDVASSSDEGNPVPEHTAAVVAGEPGLETASSAVIGVSIAMRGVSVRAAGRALIRDVNLAIAPGEHVAVVGMSGAGKSTLFGLLLGWHTPASGTLLVDGVPLDSAHLQRVRRTTAWVDPAIQLWNRSLIENLQYGSSPDARHPAGFAVTATDLQSLIERLPEGLQTALGEGGTLVSGGEGQRVRLGRALLRTSPRLVVLDEPFRGLDRDMRHAFMKVARTQWQQATLVCVTHDIDETRGFDRVLVVDDGLIVEDGSPSELRARPSRYRELWTTERDVHEHIWGSDVWRRVDVEGGRLNEPTRSARDLQDVLS